MGPIGGFEPPSYAEIVSINAAGDQAPPYSINFSGNFTATGDIDGGVLDELTLFETYICVAPGIQGVP